MLLILINYLIDVYVYYKFMKMYYKTIIKILQIKLICKILQIKKVKSIKIKIEWSIIK